MLSNQEEWQGSPSVLQEPVQPPPSISAAPALPVRSPTSEASGYSLLQVLLQVLRNHPLLTGLPAALTPGIPARGHHLLCLLTTTGHHHLRKS